MLPHGFITTMIQLIIVTNRERFLIPAINSLSADPLGNAVCQAATAKQKTIVLLVKRIVFEFTVACLTFHPRPSGKHTTRDRLDSQQLI